MGRNRTATRKLIFFRTVKFWNSARLLADDEGYYAGPYFRLPAASFDGKISFRFFHPMSFFSEDSFLNRREKTFKKLTQPLCVCRTRRFRCFFEGSRIRDSYLYCLTELQSPIAFTVAYRSIQTQHPKKHPSLT